METQTAFARHSDPETSHEAAALVDTTKLENLVLLALKRHDATTAELSAELKVARVSISPRMRPLADRGLVRDTGNRRKGIVWAINDGQIPLTAPRVRMSKATRRIVESMVKACEWAARQNHHPACPVVTYKSRTCECFVASCKEAADHGRTLL